MENDQLLTVKPFRIVFQCSLEIVFFASVGQIVKVRSEDDCVRFGEFRICSRILRRYGKRIFAIKKYDNAPNDSDYM